MTKTLYSMGMNKNTIVFEPGRKYLLTDGRVAEVLHISLEHCVAAVREWDATGTREIGYHIQPAGQVLRWKDDGTIVDEVTQSPAVTRAMGHFRRKLREARRAEAARN